MKLVIMSFGIQYGIPKEVSFIVDCRGIRNPYDSEDLRHLRGTDDAVQNQVLVHSQAKSALRYALDAAHQRSLEGKKVFYIGFMCTMGRHRSVALAEALARMWPDKVLIIHRDKDK